MPAIKFVRFLQIASPSPVPSILLVRLSSPRSNISKIFGSSSSDSPGPLSLTVKTYCERCGITAESSCSPKTISPPSGVYLTALPKTLSKICFRCVLSVRTSACFSSSSSSRRFCIFLPAIGRMIFSTSSSSCGRLSSSSVKITLPLSIFDILKILLISSSKWAELLPILLRQSSVLTLFSIFCLAIVVIPMIAFMGVRISWLICDKKALFASLAVCAATKASFNSCCCSISRRRSSSIKRATRTACCFFEPL